MCQRLWQPILQPRSPRGSVDGLVGIRTPLCSEGGSLVVPAEGPSAELFYSQALAQLYREVEYSERAYINILK